MLYGTHGRLKLHIGTRINRTATLVPRVLSDSVATCFVTNISARAEYAFQTWARSGETSKKNAVLPHQNGFIMNATTLYVEACKCMLLLDQDNGIADELFRLLPKLRQSLSCRVCRGLLVEPFGSQSCAHYVCRGCLRKKRSLNPGCRWCLNLDSLIEEKQIRIVLACYQKLCECVVQSSALRRLTTQNGEFNKTLAIIQEAITSPISLTQLHEGQEAPPAENDNNARPDVEAKVNNKMASPRSRDAMAQLSAEVKPMSKRKLLELVAEPTETVDLKSKKKKRKYFKGTYYSYNKKKKSMPAKVNKEPKRKKSAFQAEPAEHVVVFVDDKSEEIEIVDIEGEDKANSEVPGNCLSSTKPVTKIRSCKCGKSLKVSCPTVSRCVSLRCPCFSGGFTCDSCPCVSCANPYNNNNNNNITMEKQRQ